MKKTIKIFVFPSHQSKDRTSGVDFARVLQPMKHLNGWSDDEVIIKTTMFDIDKKTDWLTVAKTHDVIFFNYLNNPWGYAAMGSMARAHGLKLVMDVDDALWNIRSDNPASEVYKKGSEALYNFNAICDDVDYITTTNDYLKHVIMNNTKKKGNQIFVFPNYVDLDVYKHRSKFKDKPIIQLLHFGSTTHFIDLNSREFISGVDKIMKEYPNVSLRTVGAFIPEFRKRWGMRYENVFGHTDIYHWIGDEDKFPKFMDEADILVVPLSDDIYNRCKSSIKWVETSSAGIPGVWQDIRQYKEVIDGTNGLLAAKSSEWYKAIKQLIDNKELRKSMGEKTFEDVKGWTIQGHIGEYAQFIKSILTKDKE